MGVLHYSVNRLTFTSKDLLGSSNFIDMECVFIFLEFYHIGFFILHRNIQKKRMFESITFFLTNSLM